MAKKTFETVLKWNGGEAFRAKVEVGADGWGRVFDTCKAVYINIVVTDTVHLCEFHIPTSRFLNFPKEKRASFLQDTLFFLFALS